MKPKVRLAKDSASVSKVRAAHITRNINIRNFVPRDQIRGNSSGNSLQIDRGYSHGYYQMFRTIFHYVHIPLLFVRMIYSIVSFVAFKTLSVVSYYAKRSYTTIPTWSTKLCKWTIGTDNKGEKKKTSRWNFWTIYIEHGLDGSLLNLFRLNPIAPVLILIEFIINSINTYSTTFVTKTVYVYTTQGTNDTVSSQLAEISKDESVYVSNIKLCLYLFFVIFAVDITNFVKQVLRNRIKHYKSNILRKIIAAVVEQMRRTSPENDREFTTDDRFEALNSFVWVYDNTTDTIVNITVDTARSVTICAYLIWREPLMIIILFFTYVVMFVYMNHRTDVRTKGNSQKLWERNYYSISSDIDITKINPLFEQLYMNKPELSTLSINTTNCTFKDNDLLKKEFESCGEGKAPAPDIVGCYVDTMDYYASGHLKFVEINNKKHLVQGCATMAVLCMLILTQSYEIALILLINKGSMFSVIENYCELLRCEKNSERSLEKIVAILDAVDEQIDIKRDAKVPQAIDYHTDTLSRQRIETIEIDKLCINIPAQKRSEDETHFDAKTENRPTIPTITRDRTIVLDSATMHISPHECLLLDGATGCGKSMTISTLAGLSSKKSCRSLKVTLNDGFTFDSDFNQLLGSRCYISQTLSEEFKIYGKITLPLFKLFPGAKTIEEVTDFLVNVFDLRHASIPSSLLDHPHNKLSGGEIQRYAVASQIWKVLRVRPDILILDEVDKALDHVTAVRILEWIMTNIDSFFILVTHLTEVKDTLINRGVIKQIWTYNSTDNETIHIVPRSVLCTV